MHQTNYLSFNEKRNALNDEICEHNLLHNILKKNCVVNDTTCLFPVKINANVFGEGGCLVKGEGNHEYASRQLRYKHLIYFTNNKGMQSKCNLYFVRTRCALIISSLITIIVENKHFCSLSNSSEFGCVNVKFDVH